MFGDPVGHDPFVAFVGAGLLVVPVGQEVVLEFEEKRLMELLGVVGVRVEGVELDVEPALTGAGILPAVLGW